MKHEKLHRKGGSKRERICRARAVSSKYKMRNRSRYRKAR